MDGVIMRLYPVILLLILILGSAAQDMPRMVPEAYWGTALVDGIPAPTDSEITAEVQDTGEIVGTAKVMDGKGLYSLDVIFDNDLTEADEGAEEGQQLLWRVNGIPCDTPAPGADAANSGTANANFTISAGGETTTMPPTTVKPAQDAEDGADPGIIWPVIGGILILAIILITASLRHNKKR